MLVWLFYTALWSASCPSVLVALTLAPAQERGGKLNEASSGGEVQGGVAFTVLGIDICSGNR